MTESLGPAVGMLLSPVGIALIATGTTLGIFVGAIPGLSGAMLIALSLPLTFAMSGEHALMLLVSMYVGSVSGGLVTATLLRIPGTPASMMTTLDGYPMAVRGEANRALGLGVGASLFGGLVSWGFLAALAAPMAEFSLLFGPFEFFALVLVAIVLIATVGGGTLAAGLFAGFLGILATIPGTSPATGEVRWTLGMPELDDGFRLLPVLIGLFAINQVIRDLVTSDRQPDRAERKVGSIRVRWQDWWPHRKNLIRSSLIGTWVGILPGVGANVGSVLAYSAARAASRSPERFGQGSEEGVVASEAANNATVGGALIPLIAMGIPGSVIDAILLGALVIHGLQPGPMLMGQNPEAVHTMIGAVLLANLIMFAVMSFAAGSMVRLSRLPRWCLTPTILTFCVVGSYALANRLFDVWVMLAFGVLGFALERRRIPLPPLVIGFVLAPIAEEHLGAGLMQSGGSFLPLVTRPIAAAFCVTAVALLVWSVRRHRMTARLSSGSGLGGL